MTKSSKKENFGAQKEPRSHQVVRQTNRYGPKTRLTPAWNSSSSVKARKNRHREVAWVIFAVGGTGMLCFATLWTGIARDVESVITFSDKSVWRTQGGSPPFAAVKGRCPMPG